MSKKSRRRNKKILGALLLGGLGLAARNKRNAAIDAGVQSQKDDSGSDMLEFKEKVVSTPSVYQDSIMRGGKGVKASTIRNPKSTFIESDGSISRGDVPTGKKVGIDTKGIFVNKKGNITAGGKQYYDKNQYRTRNDKPGMLGDSGFTRRRSVMASPDLNTGAFDIGFKKGGRVKGCGKALRGFGRAMKKGKK
jgi:hypothetical protein